VNVEQLGATLTQHRGAALGAAAVGVAGLALYRKHKAGAAAAATGGDTGTSVSAGGQVAGMYGANSYDSSASDVYGLVQPQLESLGNQLSGLQDKLNNVPVSTQPVGTPTPVVAPKPAPAPPPQAAPPPPPVPVPSVAHAVDTWVTVNAGDSLSRIAARFPQRNITWQSIYNDNRGTVGGNPNLIHPGERLHILG
jgi:nucleoid-associated protein YgaU